MTFLLDKNTSLESLTALSKHIAAFWGLALCSIVDHAPAFQKDLPLLASEWSMETVGSSKFVVHIEFTTWNDILQCRNLLKHIKYINIFLLIFNIQSYVLMITFSRG
jgi:hypothetical protein